MRLRSLSLQGYRAFSERTKLEFRPLTLLFGYNSAGKSSLLRALRFLADSVDPNTTGPLDLDSRAIRKASFRDLLSAHRKSERIEFELDWQDLRANWTLLDLPDEGRQVVLALHVEAGGQQLRAVWQPEATGDGEIDIYHLSGADRTTSQGTFSSLRPPFVDAASVLQELDARLLALPDQVHWLTALRTVPERMQTLRAEPKTIEPDGSGAVAAIAYAEKRGEQSFRQLTEWFGRATGHSLGVRRQGDQVGIELSPARSPSMSVSLVDTGEGMAQVLPVVAQTGRSATHPRSAEQVLTIEHPELHLHPRAQVELARFFCETGAGSAPPSIVLETHSEHFLLEVQLAVAEGRLPRERVAIYWVRQRDDGIGMAELIELDEKGRLLHDRWPEGVFDEDIDQARRLLASQRTQSRA